jgi:hypothetical protein
VNEFEWSPVPIGWGAETWLTRRGCRNVLVAAHTLVSTQRLLDVVELVECDPRVQVLFTRPPDVFGRRVDELLRHIGAHEITWHQAIHERFDLVLAAAYGGLPELHGPIMVMAHGAGYGKPTPRDGRSARQADQGVYGLSPEQLTRDGRVVPTSIALSHNDQRDLLARSCPAAVPAAVVVGDPCYDRLAASVHLRAECRAAFGVRDEQRLVVVASTWGGQSLFGRNATMFAALLRRLDPKRNRVVMLMHPAVWAGHGHRQLRAWLSAERAAGLLLVEPEDDWRPAVLAADVVIGDNGSVPVYAAAIGKPVLHMEMPPSTVDIDSPQAFVAAHSPRLRINAPIEPQLRKAARDLPAARRDDVVARLTSQPGQSHRLLRAEMYRLLGLSVPGRHRAIEPISVPRSESWRRHA